MIKSRIFQKSQTLADWMRQMQAEGLTLADEREALKPSNWCDEIDLFLGAGEAVRILTGKTRRLEDSILSFETIFGWVVPVSTTGIENV